MAGLYDLILGLDPMLLQLIVPFLLIFTVTFAVLEKTKILGKDKKNFNVIIALCLALVTTIPHVVGGYPHGVDIVDIINGVLPEISLLVIIGLMMVLVLGIFAVDFTKKAAPWIGIVSVVLVAYFFGASVGIWENVFDWLGPGFVELIIIIVVFYIIVSWITADPKEKSTLSKLVDGLKDSFEKK